MVQGISGSAWDGNSWEDITKGWVHDGSGFQELEKSWVWNGTSWVLWYYPVFRTWFFHTGALQEYTVPTGYDKLYIKMWGGGGWYFQNPGGPGGFTEAEISVGGGNWVQAGDTFSLVVGGYGQGGVAHGGGGPSQYGVGGGGGSFIFMKTGTNSASHQELGSQLTGASWPGYGSVPSSYSSGEIASGDTDAVWEYMYNSCLLVAGGGGGGGDCFTAVGNKCGCGGGGGGSLGGSGNTGYGYCGVGGSQTGGGGGGGSDSRRGHMFRGGSSQGWTGHAGGGGLFGGGSGEYGAGGGSGMITPVNRTGISGSTVTSSAGYISTTPRGAGTDGHISGYGNSSSNGLIVISSYDYAS